MPLTKVFRMGPTPQRVSKGYVLAGDASKVSQFQAAWADRSIGGFEVLPSRSSRAVHLRGPWALLANAEIRGEFRDSLLAAVGELSSRARQDGLRVLPSATRPPGTGPWTEWTCADIHEIVVPSTTEAEVVSNAFRAASGVLIALTGRAAVDGGLGRAHSCRLLNSTEQLFARYVTSASPRNLRQVTDELRRTDGIQSLDVMDVYPVADQARLSCTVRVVDAQAFIDTTIAHALLVQAISMHYRRDARRGGRVGRMPDRLLQRHRATAISFGLAGRVQPDAPTRNNGARPPTTSLEILARDLASELEPELGSLQATFAEITPVLGWAVDGNLPRGENEYLVRQKLLTVEDLADAVERPADHVQFSRLGAGSQIGWAWEHLTTQPPAGPQSAPSQPRDESHPYGPRSRGPRGQLRQRSVDDPAPRLAALIAARGADESNRRDTVATLIGKLPRRTTELVPWDGERAEDVKTARAAGRPPADARHSVTCADFSPGSDRVRATIGLAKSRGWSLLAIDGTVAETRALTPALGSFLGGLDGCSGAVLAVVRYKDKSGARKASTEVVFIAGGTQ